MRLQKLFYHMIHISSVLIILVVFFSFSPRRGNKKLVEIHFPTESNQNSCCVGGLAKPQSTADRSLGVPQRRKTHKFSKGKRRQWSSSPEKMENSISVSYSLEAHLSSGPATANEDSKCSEENGKNLFVNQAAVAWNEMRKEWVGDRSKQPHRVPREPMISWCTTYEDLLSTSQRFPQPIPLSEMVDFLVDIWHEEGLYD